MIYKDNVLLHFLLGSIMANSLLRSTSLLYRELRKYNNTTDNNNNNNNTFTIANITTVLARQYDSIPFLFKHVTMS
jgi:hypothetical protein